MPEHLIRLRGGWLRLEPNAGTDSPVTLSPRSVTLPTTWPQEAGSTFAVRVVRSFNLPPIDPTRECLALRLADVGGLVAVHLNGREIARPAPGTTTLELPLLLPLPPRNRLVLDLELGSAAIAPDLPARPWGAIALVIGTREPPAEAGPDPGSERNPGEAPGRNADDSLGGPVP